METTEDRLLGGRVVLLQPKSGHRAGTDALLLAHAGLGVLSQIIASLRPGVSAPLAANGESKSGAHPLTGRRGLPQPDQPLADPASPLAGRHAPDVADFGAATGAAGLALAAQAALRSLTLVEIDPALAALGARNLAANAVSEGRSLALDIAAGATAREAAGLARASLDLVIMNPPFRDAGRSRTSKVEGRALAHAMPDAALEAWIRAAAHHLRPSGHIVLIHRADAAGLVAAALGKGFGGATLRFVHPRVDSDAFRLLASAKKGSRAPMRILPPLILHEADGSFTPEAAAIHNGTAARPV